MWGGRTATSGAPTRRRSGRQSVDEQGRPPEDERDGPMTSEAAARRRPGSQLDELDVLLMTNGPPVRPPFFPLHRVSTLATASTSVCNITPARPEEHSQGQSFMLPKNITANRSSRKNKKLNVKIHALFILPSREGELWGNFLKTKQNSVSSTCCQLRKVSPPS